LQQKHTALSIEKKERKKKGKKRDHPLLRIILLLHTTLTLPTEMLHNLFIIWTALFSIYDVINSLHIRQTDFMVLKSLPVQSSFKPLNILHASDFSF